MSEITSIDISYLKLANFRNFDYLTLNPQNKINIIYGPNGIGKTNILEAISLFSPGNGFKKAKLEDIYNKTNNHKDPHRRYL